MAVLGSLPPETLLPQTREPRSQSDHDSGGDKAAELELVGGHEEGADEFDWSRTFVSISA